MSRLVKTFALLKKKETGLVAFITAGDPDLETTESIVLKLEESGADIVELGVPFSDPLADGPVIQKANTRALTAGTSLKKIIELAEKIRKVSTIPLVLMTSYNPVFYYQVDKFVDAAVDAGIDGVIVPDLPPEEAEIFHTKARERGLDMIYLLAPTSSQQRIKKITALSHGFVYYISLTGITGTRVSLPKDVQSKLKEIKNVSSLPVAVGFGISSSEQVRELGENADAVVVGSAIVKIIEKFGTDKKKLLKEIGFFVRQLKDGCKIH